MKQLSFRRSGTNFLFLFFLSVIGLSSTAQITYTSANFASAGDTFTVSKAMIDSSGSYNFTQAGSNISWNYSNLQPASQYTDQYLSAASTGYKLSFVTDCIAGGGGAVSCNNQWNALVNLGHLELDSVNYGSFSFSNEVEQYNKTTSALPANILGLTFGLNGLKIPFVVTYTRPDTVYRFPLAYLNTDSGASNYSINLTSLGINFIYTMGAKRVDTVQGWGQLITPFKTYASTIKLKTLIYNYDTVVVNGAPIPVPVTTTVVYSWFDNSYKRPVLSASGILVGNSAPITNIEYLDTMRCLNPSAAFVKSPLVPYLNGTTQSVAVSFTNTSVNSNQYSWNFGDSVSGAENVSGASNPSHTYTKSGTYLATLVSCNDVCQPLRCDTLNLPVVILDSTDVQANFSYYPLQPCSSDTVVFTNLSLNATSYYWNFGDNTNSALKNPSKIYQAAGTYTITLIANGSTTSDTTTQQIAILDVPVATITPSDSVNICTGDSINLSASGGNYYVWSTGAVTSNITVYNTDNYSVKAYNNCGSNSSQPVVVNTIPTVTPTIAIQASPGDTLCSGTSVLYTAAVSNGGSLPTYEWEINDIMAGTNTDTFSYSGFLDHDVVTCLLTSNANCASTPVVTSNPIILSVNPLPPVPAINQENDTLISTSASAYQWIWNDTLLASTDNDILLIAHDGQYQVEITDSNGCQNVSGIFDAILNGINALNFTDNVQVFPNPNNGVFTLKLSGSISEVVMTDDTGREVYKAEKSAGQWALNLNYLPSGIYFLKITQGAFSTSKKLSIVK